MDDTTQPVIQFTNVSKRFTFTRETPQSVLETVIQIFDRRKRNAPTGDLWAVKDLSFEVLPGQSMGIIGRNGSGKSTVLKMMARVLRPTAGQVMVRGRVSALLELGAGFHPDLTGRENIALNASVLGLTQEDVEKHFESIVEFSELGDFIDMPVKHYSSGMYMRLGFSVAIHVDPDVLIVDEILAVGDQAFQAKCIDRILDLKRQGVTIVFISHDLKLIRRLCSHVIWLENGRVRSMGPTEEVAMEYQDYSEDTLGQQLLLENEHGSFKRWGNQEIELTAVRFLNSAGAPASVFRLGEPLTVEMHYIAHKPVNNPEFGLAFFRKDGVHMSGPNSRLGGLETGEVDGPGVIRYRVDQLPFAPARYQVTAAIHDSRISVTYDYHEMAYGFRVARGDGEEMHGLLDVPATWEWQALSAGESSREALLESG